MIVPIDQLSKFEQLGFRVDDACRAIGIGRTALYALIAKGQIKPVRIAGRTIIPRSELERLLQPEAA